MSNYYVILTSVGAAKITNAQALGQTVQLTELAVGDGGGAAVAPSEGWLALTNEVHRVPINQIYVHDTNANWLVTETVIPQEVGGWYIREVGVFDVDGDLIAVGSYPETYKPVLAEGSARDLYIRVITELGNASTVELKIDPAIVLATREYVDSHAALTAPHSATSAVIPGRLMLRDDVGRAKVATPAEANDIASKDYVDGRTQPASETVSGVIKTASINTTLEGSDADSAVTPAGLLAVLRALHRYKLDGHLVAADGANGDYFGYSVALSADGNTALVGAKGDAVGANSNQGSATVFARDVVGVWSEQAWLTATDGAYDDYFGCSVALSADGNTALVGAWGDDVGANLNQGSATVFVRDGGGVWSEQSKLTAADGAAYDMLGISVALSADGNTALVAAHGDDVGANANQGSASVFIRDGGGIWSEQGKLTAADGVANDSFGTSVALSADGNTALVGMQSDDVGANSNQGSATVFTRDGGGVWSEQAKLTAADGAYDDYFGCSVALSADGNTALVGAWSDDVGANSGQGSATVFARDGGGVWSEQGKLTAADGAVGDFFGCSVALSADGNTALVGAWSDDVGTNSGQGSATVFFRDGGGVWSEQGKLIAADGAAGDQFGVSVALSAGGNTVLVGAQFDDVGTALNVGSAYVFTGYIGVV